MAEHSTIEWTDATWNIVTGCTLVDEGCRNCYAARLAATRLKNLPSRRGLARLNAAGEAKFTGEVRFNREWLTQPLRWHKPRRIFVCAHGDLFHEAVPDEWIDRVFAVMALAPRHTFQVLTKRPARARAYLSEPGVTHRVAKAIDAMRAKDAEGDEVILPVAGFPGYLASTRGVVYSDQRGLRRSLRPDVGEVGHRRVSLSRDGVKTRFLLHRLLLETFVGPPPSETAEGRHLDGDPSHNTIANLAWGEPGENWEDSKRHGSHRRYSKLTPEQAADIRLRHSRGESGEALAREFGVSATQIRNIARGDQWAVKAPIEWPLASVWLGTSISDQASAEARIPDLLATPAEVRFLSCEPLLAPVDLTAIPRKNAEGFMRPLDGRFNRLDWIIVGGESGPSARPMHPDWARSLRDQCQAAGVAFFMKQMGGRRKPFEPIPDDLMIREFPNSGGGP